MAANEGIRRLAIFVGVLGCAAGSLVSSAIFMHLQRSKESYEAFERLANAKEIQAEQQRFREIAGPPSVGLWTPVPAMHAKYPETVWWPDDEILAIFEDPERFRSEFPQYASVNDEAIKKNIAILRKKAATEQRESFIGQDGIKTVEWDDNFDVVSVRTTDGRFFSSSSAPRPVDYLAIVSLPILGFLFPWGLLRAIGWIGAGFITNRMEL